MHELVSKAKSMSALITAALLLLGFASSPNAVAASAKTTMEVNHLLTYLETSGCEFHRNGSWHQSKQARAHLEKKFQYLDKRSLIGSSEDFITRAASTSSITGNAYLVRCPNSKATTSAEWLGAELQRYRAKRSR
jgi:hypothetical protein